MKLTSPFIDELQIKDEDGERTITFTDKRLQRWEARVTPHIINICVDDDSAFGWEIMYLAVESPGMFERVTKAIKEYRGGK